jgi:broad specificity phosphatase PhoE
MTTFFLVRHAASNTPKGVLAGRTPGVHLSPEGMQEAQTLAGAMARIRISELWSSPLERAVETASALAHEIKIPINLSATLNEVDYGQWTGKSFDELAGDPIWRRFNSSRANTPIPDGELITSVQHRMISHIEHLSKDEDRGNVVLVTHAEPIRLVLRHYLDAAGYMHDKLEISLASVSALRLTPRPTILCINHVQILSRLLET